MHVVIIGNGISGSTAARFIRKYSDYRITMISSESEYFFSRTALMYEFMGQLQWADLKPYEDWFWRKNDINLVLDEVTGLDFEAKEVHLRNRPPIIYDKLIIASGSEVFKPDLPGINLKGVTGLYHRQDLDYIKHAAKTATHAVIIGGGLIGVELAEMLVSRNIHVTMAVRESGYWRSVLPAEESALVNSQIRRHGVSLLLDTTVGEITGDKDGNVTGVILSNGEKLQCDFVGLTTGVRPNVRFLEQTGIKIDKGILVDKHLKTNIQDVYAIGDCAQLSSPLPGRKPIEAVWYTGRMMGELVANNICRQPISYNPGIWFNSAKFFDVEYQVYGFVPNEPCVEFDSVFWQHPHLPKSIRIVFRRDTLSIAGFNLMGIRYRQEVCEKWIREGAGLRQVLAELSLANFDPEFFEQYENAVLEQYFQKTSDRIQATRKKSLDDVLKFLRT